MKLLKSLQGTYTDQIPFLYRIEHITSNHTFTDLSVNLYKEQKLSTCLFTLEHYKISKQIAIQMDFMVT